MKKGNLVILVLMAALLLVLVGCSDADKEAATPAADTATETVATHDCDGPCPMKDVPMDKLTEIDGKYYCAGCAVKAKAEAEAGEKADSHEGHNHG